MNKLLLLLSVLMGVVVLLSNYLVQFPVKYFDLEEMLTFGAFTYPIAFLITDLANRFYGTGIPWVTLSFGDLAVKIFVALLMLIPFRLLLDTFKVV